MSPLPRVLADRVSPAPLLLEIDLTSPLLAQPPSDPLSWLQSHRRTTLQTVLQNLRDAAGDEHVRGLVAKVGGRMTLARAQELAEAVQGLRAAGKRVVAWAESFGELGSGTEAYVLATAFDEIWLQPSGSVGLLGVSARAVFLRDALDKLGVEPAMHQRHEYKNAADVLMRRDFSAAHREAVERLADSAYAQVVDAVATNRGVGAGTVRALIDRAPLSADEARSSGLVDRVGYRDEVYASVRREVGEEAELRYVTRYRPDTPVLRRVQRLPRRGARTFALVGVVGSIRQGTSGFSPLTGHAAGSDTVAAGLRAAVRADEVAGILLRVDSPGGSYVASDVIWREVLRAREAGKPVVVSMGDVAASGGYFVSVAADAIVALPATLTGSIGVLAGKLVTAQALERLGVAVRAVSRGANARMFSPTAPFDEAERARLDAWLDSVYGDFVGRVEQGRGMSRERVHELARGRVWTGADARRHGLVDTLGGLSAARAVLAERTGLPRDTPLRPFPHVTALQRLRRPASSEDRGAEAASLALAGWGPFAEVAATLGLAPDGPLVAPIRGIEHRPS